MSVIGAFEKARIYIETKESQKKNIEPGPCITISREPGAGADVISEKLARFFNSRQKEKEIEWAVFDRNLIEKVLEDHNLPGRLKNFMAEAKHSVIQNIMNELFVPESTWTLQRRTSETILQLARMGNCIIVGRGGNIITAKLDNVLHIRLTAPFDQRVKHVQQVYNIGKAEAIEFTKREELARRKYTLSNFSRDVTDPLQYHMIFNTYILSFDEITEIIGRHILNKYPSSFK